MKWLINLIYYFMWMIKLGQKNYELLQVLVMGSVFIYTVICLLRCYMLKLTITMKQIIVKKK